MPTNKKTVSVRLDPRLAKRLEALARKTERSVSWHINRMIDDNLPAVEAEVNAVLKGLEAVRAGRGEDAIEALERLKTEILHGGGRRVRKTG